MITVRATAFEAADASGGGAAEEAAPAPGNLPANSEYIGAELTKSDRYWLPGYRNICTVGSGRSKASVIAQIDVILCV